MGVTRNKFCRLADLKNEASVEQFFVSRLLEDLGYKDSQIKPKTSLQMLVVNLGRRRLNYKPDYAIQVDEKIRWIIEAKAVSEPIDTFIGQCSGYCLNLNRGYTNSNPVKFFLLSNGLRTKLYKWDQEEPVLELDFRDFQDDDPKYKRLLELLSPTEVASDKTSPEEVQEGHLLRRKSISQVNTDFAWCHQFIYRKDNISQSAAFMEFIKIVFLKLLADREVHRKYPEFASQEEILIPLKEAKFSTRWIKDREEDHPNPLDALQFQNLIQRLESEIRSGRKKRIFNRGEHIILTSETIKGVVGRLEHTDLFGIDADLNGRLFETFLNATMRGKDLGQYFTPRSIVKLSARLAEPKVTRDHVDTVIDACCGTGGFLIEAFSLMLQKVNANRSFTSKEKEELKKTIATERIYGVDVAVDPNLARIARMNMYLHGDGGSSIYQADILDQSIEDLATDSAELKQEKSELRLKLEEGGFADVVLTNPPFAKEYSRNYKREDKILDDYQLAFDYRNGKRVSRPSLKSSLMFFERYYQVLKAGGRMITVVDDSILGGKKYKVVREFIRGKFLIKAVISLPGDAFQRSKARVKTSLLYVQKRQGEEEQPPIFMYYCTKVGVDDPARQRVLPIDEQNRIEADREIDTVCTLFKSFLDGASSAEKWIVPVDFISGRMDVKSCLPKPNRSVSAWKAAGLSVVSLSQLIDVVYPKGTNTTRKKDKLEDEDSNLIATSDSDEMVTYLRVRYDGFAEAGEEIYASDSTYSKLYRVSAGDIVISNINAVHGAIAIVPNDLDNFVVTAEYTVCRAKADVNPRLVWLLLRSPEARSNLILLSTGIGRSRVSWDRISALKLPMPPNETVKESIDAINKAEELESEARKLRRHTFRSLDDMLGLDGTEAKAILEAFKPPN